MLFFGGMKWVFLFFVTATLYAQRTVSIPVIIVQERESATWVKASDLKVDIDSAPTTIVSLTPLAANHLQYVLLNDQSGKSFWPGGINQQVDVASEFLKQVITPGADSGTLVNFSDEVFLDVKSETDPHKILAHLARHGIGGTRMFDAVVSATKWLQKQKVTPDARKIIILFSDGDDNESYTSLQQAVETLQKASIPVFVIAPSSIEIKKQGHILRQLSAETGGRVYFLPQNTQHISFDFMKQDLAQSFLLTVNSPSAKAMLPIHIRDVADAQVSVLAASRVAAP